MFILISGVTIQHVTQCAIKLCQLSFPSPPALIIGDWKPLDSSGIFELCGLHVFSSIKWGSSSEMPFPHIEGIP